ncbi:GIY-YIG nuclease family protein [Sphingopyxis sp. L1A2A]|uniref:GIY-YIG nuclease family protein n=1 Tax=Sphingopyxis sp. L1A2A TaxID=2502247 RepID=UPI0010F975C4|nr:GIY-YIG nuclease family protein [Sphingopyxis sp. L1A2A]
MHENFGPTAYILASRRNGTLYTGVTSHLVQRVHQHREELIPGFTREYGVKMLVWFEQHATMDAAIQREKRIKKWNRAWKLELIERDNPDWRDLAEDFGFEPIG